MGPGTGILLTYCYLFISSVPSKLLTSTLTHNFVRESQKIKKIVGASRLKKGILSQKLLSLKYFSKCQKIFRWLLLFVLFTSP